MSHFSRCLVLSVVAVLMATMVTFANSIGQTDAPVNRNERHICCWEDISRITESILPSSAEETRALLGWINSGQQVGVVVYYVKPDKKQAFEQFVTGVLLPAAQRTEPGAAANVRFMTNAGLHPDGTYHEAFLFDPVVPGGEYQIENILDQTVGRERREQYMKEFDTWVTGYSTEDFTESL